MAKGFCSMHRLISHTGLLFLLAVSAPVNCLQAKSEPDWSFAVEGMPAIEGSVVVKTGIGANFKYSAASADATISFSMPGERLVIKYREAKFTCVNSPETVVHMDNNRTTFSGAVRCFIGAAKPDEREGAAIEGWLDLQD